MDNQTVVTAEKVGSQEVSASDKIECEVCGAHYHALQGSKNDCPLCNAPGGKGVTATVGTSLAGNPLAPQVEALGKTVAQLQARVAQLEADFKLMSEKVAT